MMNDPPGQSKIKIYGPPIARTMIELEKIAKEMPTISEGLITQGMIPSGKVVVGDYDFVFYWDRKPTEDQLRQLIARIDGALEGLGCRYTITTLEASSYPYEDRLRG